MAKKKTPSEKQSPAEKLAQELTALIPRLDEEGLAFLVEQAHIHLYNMQVDELNHSLEENALRSAKKTAQGKTAQGKNAAPDGFSEIKVSGSGSSYYIVYKTEWIMFSKDEMILLVEMAGGEGTDLEIRERLYNWFARERSDLLRSAGIADKFDPKLKTLTALLRGSFRLRKK